MKSVSVELSEFAFEALAGEASPDTGSLSPRLIQAIRLYLSDKEVERPGWRYPAWRQGRETGAMRSIDLSIDEDLWSELATEAIQQGTSVDRLAEHAALYFAAELNAGRITERILDDFEPPGDEG